MARSLYGQLQFMQLALTVFSIGGLGILKLLSVSKLMIAVKMHISLPIYMCVCAWVCVCEYVCTCKCMCCVCACVCAHEISGFEFAVLGNPFVNI